MAKVLKLGRYLETIRVHCSSCGSKIELTKFDVDVNPEDALQLHTKDEVNSTCKYTCPVCHEINLLLIDDLPDSFYLPVRVR